MTTSTGTQMPPATAGSGSPEAERPEEACARQVDGLFTYCLSVLCDHDAALAALQSVRDMAVRHHERLRDPALSRAWLYSLARFACLVRLQGPAGVPPEPAGDSASMPSAEQLSEQRDRLAALAWPEAAGTTPEQREALELAVRHGLAPYEVAAVLGLSPEDTAALLAQAACEVERTRTALLVLKAADCPELAHLGGARPDSGQLLGPALRRELVQHVDDCPTCRGTAERAVAAGPWPGASALQAGGGPAMEMLPLVPAPAGALAGAASEEFQSGSTAAGLRPRAARHARQGAAEVARRLGVRRDGRLPHDTGSGPAAPFAAQEGVPHAGAAAEGGRDRGPARREGAISGPRFDRRGFPQHRADSPDLGALLRNKAVTTTVVAAVLAAPLVSLWVAHRDGSGGDSGASVSAVRVEAPAAGIGGSSEVSPSSEAAGGSAETTVTAMVLGANGAALRAVGETLPPAAEPSAGAALPIPVAGVMLPGGVSGASPKQAVPVGRLTVEAKEYGSRTVVTLTNSGSTTIHWHAVIDAAWLRLSRDSGVLEPGRRITVIVTVDKDRVPRGHWTAHIALQPSEAVVTLEGSGRGQGGSSPRPAHSGPAHSGPAHSGPSHSGPAHSGPAHSGPDPTHSAPAPSSPDTKPPAGGPAPQPSPSTSQPPESPPSPQPSPSPADPPAAAASPDPTPRAVRQATWQAD